MTATNKIGAYRIGIYPGTFDPITLGHIHIIRRAAKLVDHLIVAVADNSPKKPLFDLAQRVEMVKTDTDYLIDKGFSLEVKSFNKLLVHYARDEGACVVFRGLRATSDFEYEFQMTGMNNQLDPEIETLFMMASNKHQFVSSAFVKEIARMGGDVSNFASENVRKHLNNAFPS